MDNKRYGGEDYFSFKGRAICFLLAIGCCFFIWHIYKNPSKSIPTSHTEMRWPEAVIDSPEQFLLLVSKDGIIYTPVQTSFEQDYAIKTYYALSKDRGSIISYREEYSRGYFENPIDRPLSFILLGIIAFVLFMAAFFIPKKQE